MKVLKGSIVMGGPGGREGESFGALSNRGFYITPCITSMLHDNYLQRAGEEHMLSEISD